MKFYIVASRDELGAFINKGRLPFHSEDETDARMDNWMLQQMKSKLPSTLFEGTPDTIGPHWLFPCNDDKNDSNLPPYDWLKGFYLVKIVKDKDDVLFFDDNSWVMVANNVLNDNCSTFLAYSEEEAALKENATVPEIQNSWERMFDVNSELRDEEYCGPVELRAVTPYVDFDSVIEIKKM
jgi:hypothetical protein